MAETARYTLSETEEITAAQSRLDKALISRCIEGLGLYAAQIAAENKYSSEIGEIRELAETLIGYWGLDCKSVKPAEEIMAVPLKRADGDEDDIF